jgi:DNA-directed RNA polymerase subunit RPC12/RpoP
MGGFLENLKKFFSPVAGNYSADFITFKVRCNKCGEEITVKVRKNSDISRVYEGEGKDNAEYFSRKEVLGKKCSNLIYIEVYFGPGFNIISKDIRGGEFIE